MAIMREEPVAQHGNQYPELATQAANELQPDWMRQSVAFTRALGAICPFSGPDISDRLKTPEFSRSASIKEFIGQLCVMGYNAAREDTNNLPPDERMEVASRAKNHAEFPWWEQDGSLPQLDTEEQVVDTEARRIKRLIELGIVQAVILIMRARADACQRGEKDAVGYVRNSAQMLRQFAHMSDFSSSRAMAFITNRPAIRPTEYDINNLDDILNGEIAIQDGFTEQSQNGSKLDIHKIKSELSELNEKSPPKPNESVNIKLRGCYLLRILMPMADYKITSANDRDSADRQQKLINSMDMLWHIIVSRLDQVGYFAAETHMPLLEDAVAA